MHGNLYEVDPAPAGARVELVFDPFDLTDITVHHHGRTVGKAIPHRIGRHVHPKAHADPAPAPTPTGIDYLRLVADRHTRSMGQRLHYAQLADPAPPLADPAPLAEPAPPTGPGVASSAEATAADRDGLAYHADLPTLAHIDTPDSPDPEESR